LEHAGKLEAKPGRVNASGMDNRPLPTRPRLPEGFAVFLCCLAGSCSAA
jgi:hypothetical protein